MTRTRSVPSRVLKRTQILGRALIPVGGEIPFGIDDVDLETLLTEFWDSTWLNRTAFAFASAILFWVAPFLLLGKLRSFGGLSAQDQEAMLHKAHAHTSFAWRGMLLIINSIVQMAYYSDPKVMQALGYENYIEGRNMLEGHRGESSS